MKVLNPKPPILIARTFLFLLQGRIHYDKDIIGKIVHEDDKKRGQTKDPGAIFRVTFSFAKMSISTNKKLSLIPIPLIIGQPGFRSKTWMIGKKTERFQGFYEWDTVESAENYWSSFPMKLMKRRSTSGTLNHEIHSVDNK
jgi:hypothetical protein